MSYLKRIDPKNDRKKMLFFSVFALVFFSAIMTKCQGKQMLPAVVKENTVATEKVNAETEKETLPLIAFKNAELGFTLKVPKGWREVQKNGFPLFVDAKTKSSIQIRTTSLDIEKATMEADAQNTKITADGGTFLELRKLTDSSNMLLYKKQSGGTIYDYVELNSWSLNHTVSVQCIIDDAYYGQVGPTIEKVLDSLEWTKDVPVPKNCVLGQSKEARVYYAIPSAWTYSSTQNSISGTEEATGAVVSVLSVQNKNLFKGMTQNEYISTMAGDKKNFVLSKYRVTDRKLSAEAVYMENGTKMSMQQAAVATGKYQVILTYEYPADNVSEETLNIMKTSMTVLELIKPITMVKD